MPRTALEMAATNVGLDSLEFLCSEDAQQLSACAWVMTRFDPELGESPLCIGHVLSEQHAIRASGVEAQPAHTAALLATRASAMATAETRLNQFTTALRMQGTRQTVKLTRT